eukprot:gene6165-13265_t
MPVYVYTLALALTTLAAPTVAVLTCGAGPGGRIVQAKSGSDEGLGVILTGMEATATGAYGWVEFNHNCPTALSSLQGVPEIQGFYCAFQNSKAYLAGCSSVNLAALNSVIDCLGHGINSILHGCECTRQEVGKIEVGYIGPACQYGPLQFAEEQELTEHVQHRDHDQSTDLAQLRGHRDQL